MKRCERGFSAFLDIRGFPAFHDGRIMKGYERE